MERKRIVVLPWQFWRAALALKRLTDGTRRQQAGLDHWQAQNHGFIINSSSQVFNIVLVQRASKTLQKVLTWLRECLRGNAFCWRTSKSLYHIWPLDVLVKKCSPSWSRRGDSRCSLADCLHFHCGSSLNTVSFWPNCSFSRWRVGNLISVVACWSCRVSSIRCGSRCSCSECREQRENGSAVLSVPDYRRREDPHWEVGDEFEWMSKSGDYLEWRFLFISSTTSIRSLICRLS